MWAIGVVCVALLVIYCTHLINKWRKPKCNGVLPPGSMGLPLIGETLQLIIPSYSMDIHPFFKKRLKKYGPIFRTSLLGEPVVVSTDPELNNLIFHEEGNLAEMYYMDSFSNLFSLEGEKREDVAAAVHRYIRYLPSVYFGLKELREGLLGEIERMVVDNLRNWSKKDYVEMKKSTEYMLCEFMSRKVFSYDPKIHSSSKFVEKLGGMAEGLLCVPVNIPGSTYNRLLKDKESVMKFLKDIIDERLKLPENSRGDFLDKAIAEMKTEKFLTRDFLNQYLFGIVFGGSQSNPSTVTSGLSFLHANPKVLEELAAEHEAIIKNRENPNSPLSWDEYKSMTFTHQVVNEVLRLTNVIPGFMRKALKDIHHKGYTIPAGWAILVATTALHVNPEIYEDPLTFDPWRWKDNETRLQSRIFKPFGEGARQCAGAEFTKAFQATFLHVLVTKYTWRKVKGGNFYRNPLLGSDGLYINFKEKN